MAKCNVQRDHDDFTKHHTHLVLRPNVITVHQPTGTTSFLTKEYSTGGGFEACGRLEQRAGNSLTLRLKR